MRTLRHATTTALLLTAVSQTPVWAAIAVGPPVEVTYVANEGFLIEGGGKKVLIDSLFDTGFDEYLAPTSALLEEMTGARGPFADVDLLLVSHPHGDHFNSKLVTAHLRNNPRGQLVAGTQVVDRLRQEEGFSRIAERVHEVKGEVGSREHLSVNGIAVDALCLAHAPYYREGRNVHENMRDLAFSVDLGGSRFLHLGDATVEHSGEQLSAYPFDRAPIDILFVAHFDRSQATRELIGRRIRPSRIVAMHVPPADLREELTQIWEAFPWATVFTQSMERRPLPIEVELHHLRGDYFGQAPPRAVPQVFARGIVSSDLQEHGPPSFHPDGNEMYWVVSRWPGPDNADWISSVVTMRRENGQWSAPYTSPLSHLPAFSADGRRAYFNAPQPGTEQRDLKDDLWVLERRGDEWGEPRCLDLVARYPELRFAFWPTVARTGTLYFGAYMPGPLNDYGIYRAEAVGGGHAKPEPLPRSINLPPFLNWTPFPAPDESYVLFSSSRAGNPNDDGDLYVSHRLADGSWTDPVSLGEAVNSNRQERLPMLSNDGKYLFFSRETPDHSEDVFWVDAATIPALRPPQQDPR